MSMYSYYNELKYSKVGVSSVLDIFYLPPISFINSSTGNMSVITSWYLSGNKVYVNPPLLLENGTYTMYDGDYSDNSDIPFVDTRKVSWSSFGNRTTKEGEFLYVENLQTVVFRFYTGVDNLNNHNYSFIVSELDKFGKLIPVHVSPLPCKTLENNKTYDMRIQMNSKTSLHKGNKYVFHVYDATSFVYISSVGVIPKSSVLYIPTSAPTYGDLFAPPVDGDNTGAPPLGDIGNLLPPKFDGDLSDTKPETYFELVIRFFNGLIDGFVTMINKANSFFGSITSFGKGFANFLGGFFLGYHIAM